MNMVIRPLIAALLIAAATPGWAVDVSVTDGDTLIVNGVAYRLVGIEAPQTDQTCLDDKGAPWTCGIDDVTVCETTSGNATCVAPTGAP